jgi:competence protein ComEA
MKVVKTYVLTPIGLAGLFRRPPSAFRFAGVLLGLVSAAVASAQKTPQFPDGPGKDAFVRICSACHGAQIVMDKGLTEDGWTQVVLNMVERGAQGSEEDFGTIVAYLSKNYPPKTASTAATAAKVNVNKASADDITKGLDLAPKDAQAIVAYREQNGLFKTFDELRKVPGVDAAKIDAKKDLVTF